MHERTGLAMDHTKLTSRILTLLLVSAFAAATVYLAASASQPSIYG